MAKNYKILYDKVCHAVIPHAIHVHGEPSKPRGSLHWGSQMKNNYIHETISNKILNIK